MKGVSEIDGRKVAIDWSLPREVYEAEKNAQKSEEAESEPEEEDDEETGSEPESSTDPLDGLVDDSDNSDSEDSGNDTDEDLEEDEEIVEEKPLKSKIEPKRKSEPAPDVLEGRSVFLRNVPFDATEEDLEELCGKYGAVKKARIVKNEAGASKGVAFVEVIRSKSRLCLIYC